MTHPHMTSSKDGAVAALIASAEILTAWCHDAKNKGDNLNLDHLRDLRARVSPLSPLLAAIARMEGLTPARHRSPIDPPQPPPRKGNPTTGMDRMAARRTELGIVR